MLADGPPATPRLQLDRGPHPLARLARLCLDPETSERPGHLRPRWIFLRMLGLIYFSAFLSLLTQINGLIGPRGLLPAGQCLAALRQHFGLARFWYAPSLLWIANGAFTLELLCWLGLAAALLLIVNRWPRWALAAAEILFLSYVVAAQDFSAYQSDGMLLAAGLIAWFFSPPGRRPGLGRHRPPTPASLFLLQWLWFRIYFESGLAKLLSGDPQWRHWRALDQYYQNCPLPTWIGWFMQHLPHGFHAAMTGVTLALELGLCWMLFMPRRARIACFGIVTAFQVGLALTANYAFINWIEGGLGVLLLDDLFFSRLRLPRRPKNAAATESAPRLDRHGPARRWTEGMLLGWVFYVTLALLLWMPWPRLPLPTSPVAALEPFRVANQYGLFAVMTRARFEIEFQGSPDGRHWTPYPFRFKPQALDQAPPIYAPYQPRFDWNLWFTSLGSWRQYPWVVRGEALLLENDPAVVSLFARNPFPRQPPRFLRTVLWQYWFTDLGTWRRTGAWWRRADHGLYAPELERLPNGQIAVVAWP